MVRHTLLAVLLALLSGCATRSLFHPYPDQARAWKEPAGPASAGVPALQQAIDGRDGVLYLQELGRIEQMSGDPAASRTAFARAIEHYRNTDARALLRVSGLAADTAALLLNDNARPYVAPDYERIFTRTYQALNYWANGDVTGTAVELRAAAGAQRRAARKREEDIAEADQALEQHHIDTARYQGYFQGLDAAIGQVKASFQNAWTFYLSALFWEAHGNYNDALVDYKKALEIHPGLDMIKEDIERVSAALDGHPVRERGLLAVLYEQGWVPPRREISLPVPTPHGLFAVAFPTYSAADKPAVALLTVTVGTQQARTRVLADVGGLAAKALREQLPAMLLRQALRATTKYALQKKANDDFGPAGAVLTQLFNLASEQADRRSWLSLPAYAQAARLLLPPGEHTVVLSTPQGNARLMVPVVARGLTVIRVMAPPGQRIIQVLPVQEGPL